MISKISAREILIENEIKNKLKECFQKCAQGRLKLKKCVDSAMDAGLSREEILSITEGNTSEVGQYEEASLCAVIVIGQMLSYEKKYRNQKSKSILLTDNNKVIVKNKLNSCFRKCVLAKRQLRKCIGNAMDAGLTKSEVLAITDDIVGGLGESQVSLCAIVAIDHALSYEENLRAKPIDIVKERKLVREDT